MIKKNLFCILIVCCLSAIAQKQDNLSNYQKMVHLIDSGYFSINVDKAIPMSGNIVNLTTFYYGLDFYQDSVVCYLPYFGISYNVPIYPNDWGIKFTMPVKDFEKKYNASKKRCDIQFAASDDGNDSYDFYITIFDNNNVSISVNSNFKQSINYSGYISRLNN